MSFYFDEEPSATTDPYGSSNICPHCGSTSFYDDPVSGNLTCSSCYAAVLTSTQEEFDNEEKNALAADWRYTLGGRDRRARGGGGGGGGRGGGGGGGRPAKDIKEFDQSRPLPDVESCCRAFQWLLWDASKCVAKLAGIEEGENYEEDEDEENSNGSNHSLMETTVRKIWFTYLETWMEASQYYSQFYPEMRVSFRDFFLDNGLKSLVARHLNVTIGKKVEDEMLGLMEQQLEDMSSDDEEGDGRRRRWKMEEESESEHDGGKSNYWNDSSSPSSSEDDSDLEANNQRQPNSRTKSRKRPPITTITKLRQYLFRNAHLHPDAKLHYVAVLSIEPSLTLLLSILQLSLTTLQTGIAPYHLTHWVANGELPHGLNGYSLLPRGNGENEKSLKEEVVMVRKFFERSFVPPAKTVEKLTDFLAVACRWYNDDANYEGGANKEERMSRKSRRSGNRNLSKIPQIKVECSSDVDCSSHSSGPVKKSKNGNAHPKKSVEMSTHYNSMPSRSRYNVPLLAARMVQDFGMEQLVLDKALALMGVIDDSFLEEREKKIGNERSKKEDDIENNGKHKNSNSARYNKRSKSSHDSSGYTNNTRNESALPLLPPALKCCSPDQLYTTLHVAAVIVIAVKFCPGWERWRIINLHAPSAQSSEPSFVPWNEAQLRLLGNGATMDRYLDFLEDTALVGLETPSSVANFFKRLNKDLGAQNNEAAKNEYKHSAKQRETVTPNIYLSGAQNPNEPQIIDLDDFSRQALLPSAKQFQFLRANNIGKYTYYTTHQYQTQDPFPQDNKKQKENKTSKKHKQPKKRERPTATSMEPYHPHYCRLIEYICYTVEETNPQKLHDLVGLMEVELLSLEIN